MESEWAYLDVEGIEGKERKTRSRAVRVVGVNSSQICKIPSSRHTPSQNTQAEEAPKLKQRTVCIMRSLQKGNGQLECQDTNIMS